jgi:hypothetical protein
MAPRSASARPSVGAVQIPAIGVAGAYWPLAAAAPAGFPGLDSDIKGVLVNPWPVAFPAFRTTPPPAPAPVLRNRPRLPRAKPILRYRFSIRTSSSRSAPIMKIICAR